MVKQNDVEVEGSPTQKPLPVPGKQLKGQRLGEHVRWLQLRVNSFEFKRSVVPASVLHKVEVLVVDVLSPGAYPLWPWT